MPERFIPHEHQCPICGTVSGCENKLCRGGQYFFQCENVVCQERWAHRTVHASANQEGILPCCQRHKSQTPPEDTMDLDSSRVTCKGVVGVELADSVRTGELI